MVTVKELKATLKDMGLPQSGKKSELIERIDKARKNILSPWDSRWMKGRCVVPLNEDNIWKASSRGDIGVVRWFIHRMKMEAEESCHGSFGVKKEYDIDQLSPFGRSALHHASLSGFSSIVRLLLSEGAIDYNGTAYLAACILGWARDVLREHGFTGKSFVELSQVRLLTAKRNLLLVKMEIDYDNILEIEHCVRSIFIDKPIYRRALQKAMKE